MTPSHIRTIRIELLAAKSVALFVASCSQRRIASQRTAYQAITADTFKPENGLHRLVVRHAILFLQERGRLVEWTVDTLCPEALPAPLAAAA